MSNRIEELKRKTEKLKQDKARAEMEIESASLRATQARESLLTQFKISTVEEGKALVAKMDAALSNAIEKIEEQLREAEGL